MAEHELFTEPWAKAYCRALNENEDYADAGEDWEGEIGLLVRADPQRGIEEDRAVVLDLAHGECHGSRVVEGQPAGKAAPHVIEGSLSTWYDVLDGELAPLKALMFGKLKLAEGKLRDLLPYTRASREMVQSAREVSTSR